MSDEHHRYYKHTKFRQNPRGDPKFLVDLTWNDPLALAAILLICGDHDSLLSNITPR